MPAPRPPPNDNTVRPGPISASLNAPIRDVHLFEKHSQRVDSPSGQLAVFDGVPHDTVFKAYEAFDLMCGIEVFLNAVPHASPNICEPVQVSKGVLDSSRRLPRPRRRHVN